MIRQIGALLAIVAVLATSSYVQSAQSNPPSGLVVGQVIDAASGKPIAGATVRIAGSQPSRPPGAAPSAHVPIVTGPDGWFVFRNLPRGNYNILALKPGYAEGAYGRRRPGGLSVQLTLADGERTDDAQLRMWKHSAISGSVVDEAGEPVVSACVRAWRRSFNRGRYMLGTASVAGTDDRGMYRLTNLLPGDYVIGAPSRGLAGTTDRFAQVGNPCDVLSFTSRVGAVPARDDNARASIYPTTYHPSVTMSTLSPLTSVGSGEERIGIDIQLQPVPAVRVSGTVTRSDGPVAGIPLRLVPTGTDDWLEDGSLVTATDGQGGFTFPAVPAGQYALRINTVLRVDEKRALLTTLWAEEPLAVASEDIVGVVVPVRTGGRITGRLEFEGSRLKAPIRSTEQIPLVIDALDRTPLSQSVWAVDVDGNGQFASGGLPPGRYFVSVSGSPVGWMFKSATFNGRDVSETPLELHGEDVHVVLTYTDRWTGVTGTVTSPGGAPEPDAAVLVFPADPELWSGYGGRPRRLKSTRTRKNGEYNFNSLPPGRYHLVAVAEEGAAAWPEPAFLQALARVSTPLTIGEGEQATRSLRTQVIK